MLGDDFGINPFALCFAAVEVQLGICLELGGNGYAKSDFSVWASFSSFMVCFLFQSGLDLRLCEERGEAGSGF